MTTSWKHANVNQAQEAGMDLFPRLLPGGTKDTNQMVLDAECLASYGLGMAFPSVTSVAATTTPATKSSEVIHQELAELLRPLAEEKDPAKRGAINWLAIAKLALQFILSALGCLLLCLLMSQESRADNYDAEAAVAVAKARLAVLQLHDTQKEKDNCGCAFGLPCNCSNGCLCYGCLCSDCPGDQYKSIEAKKKQVSDPPETGALPIWEEREGGWKKSRVTGEWYHPQYGFRPANYIWASQTPILQYSQPAYYMPSYQTNGGMSMACSSGK